MNVKLLISCPSKFENLGWAFFYEMKRYGVRTTFEVSFQLFLYLSRLNFVHSGASRKRQRHLFHHRFRFEERDGTRRHRGNLFSLIPFLPYSVVAFYQHP